MTKPFERRPAPGLLLGLVLGALAVGTADRLWFLTEEEDVVQYRRVRDFVSEAFVGDTGPREMLDDALHGLARGLDEYSRYYDGDETRDLERETAGRYTGIGAVFRQPLSDARVLFTLPGSPAQRAGLEVGDRIVGVGEGDDEVRIRDERALRALLAPGGPAELRLSVVGFAGVERRVTVRRDVLVDPTVRHQRLVDPQRGIGYLAIGSFSHETPGEFDRAFEELRAEGMRGLIVDLRGNPGGVLSAAVRIAQRFVVEGVIVSTEGRSQPTVHRADEAQAWYRGTPLVLLVDSASASASEVLAGALQDHRCAVLVGGPTYGKGMVQTIRHFPEAGSVVKVTTSHYYTPARRNLERSVEPARGYGIEPDLVIPLGPEEEDDLHERLARYSPPKEALAALRAWEELEGVSLIEPAPSDAQFTAACELLAGRRPGPHSGGDT